MMRLNSNSLAVLCFWHFYRLNALNIKWTCLDWTPLDWTPTLQSDAVKLYLHWGVKHHKLCPVSYNCHCLGCCPRLVCPPDISIPKWTSLEITNSVGWSEEDDARGDCQSAR